MIKKMEFNNPVLVIAPWKSGSSMCVGLFHRNGFWVGPDSVQPGKTPMNPKGYFENWGFSQIAKDFKGGLIKKEQIKALMHNEMVRNQGYAGEPWALKFRVGNDPDIHLYGFKPIYVFVWRKIEDCVQSQLRHRALKIQIDPNTPHIQNQARLAGQYASRYRWMEEFKKTRALSFDIHPSRIIKGDYSELKKILKHCLMPYYGHRVNKFVSAKFWHFETGEYKEGDYKKYRKWKK